MSYQLRPAQRSQAKPLVGIYSESGAGKTYSGLVLARGFVGPAGRICMIETEGGRGESYSDKTEYPEIGGYDVIPIRENFAPAEYGAALTAAEQAKVDALIIDSASHEWEGNGGVLSMAAANQARGLKGVIVWQQPKIEHQRHFMLRLIQTPIPLVIVCMRAKYPMVERQKQGGGKEWVRSEALEPKQAEDILFEMFVHGWIDHQHKFRLTKCTAKALQSVFVDGQPLTVETGRKMAAWARSDEHPKTDNKPNTAESTPRDVPPEGTAPQFSIVRTDGKVEPRASIQDWLERWQKILAFLVEKGNTAAIKQYRELNGTIMASLAAAGFHDQVMQVQKMMADKLGEPWDDAGLGQ